SGVSASTGSTSLVVNPVASSQTSVTLSSNSATVGTLVTYSANVTPNGTGLPTPTGTVTFTTGTTSLCTATLMPDGTGSCSSSAAPVGTETIIGTDSADSE